MSDKNINCIIHTGEIQNFKINIECNNINNLRLFHNFIKKELIFNSTKSINGKNLLDIACGRGGDLNKWSRAKLKFVFAFDYHEESIKIANDRYKNIKKGAYNSIPFISFNHLSMLDPDILNKINKSEKEIKNLKFHGKYDIVSCQFALHYFAQNESSLNNLLNTVSRKLKYGGLFIGTTTDGDLIENILKHGDVKIPLLTLIKKNNNSYIFNINSEETSRQNYFELQGESLEYYVFKDQLTQLALKNNLKLIEFKPFSEWYSKWVGEQLNPYEMIVSFLNFSFIFQKF